MIIAFERCRYCFVRPATLCVRNSNIPVTMTIIKQQYVCWG